MKSSIVSCSTQSLPILGTWLLLSAAFHLVWEIVQLPLFALWYDAQPLAIAWAVVHCVGGDTLISLATFLLAAAILGGLDWPVRHRLPGLWVSLISGEFYTAFSEWRNVEQGAWAYANAMPTIGGIGLSPLAEWVVVPMLAVWILRWRFSAG